jgi:hypothetical protein
MKARWSGLLALIVLADASWATQQGTTERGSAGSMPQITFEGMAAPERDLVLSVMDKPTLHAKGSQESFSCRPEHFCWFLDHPDRAVVAWRRLGARCVSITPRGPGTFAWSDTMGSEVVWVTVQASTGQRIWFAQGKVKPTALLPAIPVKAVVVLRYTDSKAADGTATITQQAHVFVHTDSKSAALVTKMLGNSSQRIAEQGVDQLQLFFSGLSWYMHRHPEQSHALLRE